uniref:Uncharacterized protein n=1 Tax=Arundo donax TaxID=35708 RepID=A0A0A9H4X6_ARUDO
MAVCNNPGIQIHLLKFFLQDCQIFLLRSLDHSSL